jgi:hypothetical protein
VHAVSILFEHILSELPESLSHRFLLLLMYFTLSSVEGWGKVFVQYNSDMGAFRNTDLYFPRARSVYAAVFTLGQHKFLVTLGGGGAEKAGQIQKLHEAIDPLPHTVGPCEVRTRYFA